MDGEDKHTLYFCTYHKFKQYANVCFFHEQTPAEQESQKLQYAQLNCVNIIKRSPTQTVMHHEDRGREVMGGDGEGEKTGGEIDRDTSFILTVW